MTLAAEPFFHFPKVILLRSTLRASEMTSWVESTLQAIKGKANVSQNYYYSEKSFAKCLWYEPSHLRRCVCMPELVLPGLFSFGIQELTLGICPLWKMTCFVNVNDSETFLRGILTTYKSEAQPEYSDT